MQFKKLNQVIQSFSKPFITILPLKKDILIKLKNF